MKILLSIQLHLFFIFTFLTLSNFLHAQEQSTSKPLPNKLMLKVKRGFVKQGNNALMLSRLAQNQNIKKQSQPFLHFQKKQSLSRARVEKKSSKKTTINLADYIEVEFNANWTIEQAIAYFSEQDWVDYAEPIYTYKLLTPPFIPSDTRRINQEPHLGFMQIYDAWGISKGDTSISIAILDTGLQLDHPDIKNKIHRNYAEIYGINGVDDDNNGYVDDSIGYDFAFDDPVPEANHTHGTNTAGLAGAETDNNEGITSTGYNCRIMPLKIFNNSLFSVRVYEAMLYAAENGASIINMSLGSPSTFSQWEQDIITYISLEENVLIVAAAGNDGYEHDFYPASYKYVTSVTHSDKSGQTVNCPTCGAKATYNTNIDLLAPGGSIYTTFWNSNYGESTGSSMASPVVAGVAGLIRAKYPTLNAIQVGELLRVSTDSIYHLSRNKNYFEKLGKGRLNAFRALSEKNTAKSIRMENITSKSTHQEGNFGGDTVRVIGNFINYLNLTTSTCKVTISSTDPNITIIDSVFTIGILGELDTTTNSSQPFRILVNKNAGADRIVKIRLGYQDDNYQDYQYFDFKIKPVILNIDFNEISLTVCELGRIGNRWSPYFNPNSTGIGIKKGDTVILAEASLMIGYESGQVSDRVITNSSKGYFGAEFRGVFIDTLSNPRFLQDKSFIKQSHSLFADTTYHATYNTNQIGVQIEQITTGRTIENHANYVLFEYRITNLSGATLDSLNVGIYADWNIGNIKNKANWNQNEDFAYIFEDNGIYSGIKVFDDTLNYFAIDLESSIGGTNINTFDGFSDSEKHQSLASRMGRTEAGYTGAGNNVAHVVGTTIFNIPDGATDTVSFAIMVGNNVQELEQISRAAAIMVQPTQSPKPTMDTVLCASSPIILPMTGTSFAFYIEDDTLNPVYVGDSYTIPQNYATKKFWITNLDSGIESEAFKTTFELVSPITSFTGTTNVTQQGLATFSDTSPDVISRTWDFGDGGQAFGNPNPNYIYTTSGTFIATLTITNSMNCIGFASSTIIVTSVGTATSSGTLTQGTGSNVNPPQPSPNPIINTLFCADQPLIIAPSNGNLFNFYGENNILKLLHRGQFYTLNPSELGKKFYISNISNGLESSRLRFIFRQLKADFDAPSELFLNTQDTLVQFGNKSGIALSYLWDFGDATTSTQENPSHLYSAQGIYTVKLMLEGIQNCRDTLSKELSIIRQSVIPNLPDLITACWNEEVIIKPDNGTKFRFYDTFPIDIPFYEGDSLILTDPEFDLLYVSSIDSLQESIVKKVEIKRKKLIADFVPNPGADTVLYVAIDFKDQSESERNIIQWKWEFGDDSVSFESNPKHQYQQNGIYQVKLTITDLDSCTSSVSKEIKVGHRGLTPEIADLLVCKDELLIIEPKKGSLFNFYIDNTLTEIVHSGEKYELIANENTPKKLFITSIDSIIESFPTQINIRVTQAVANMNFDRELFLDEKQEVEFEDLSQNSVSWLWDFGDGTSSKQQNPKHTYLGEGNYQVSLTITNTDNCQATKSLSLLAFRRSPKPIIGEHRVCFGDRLIIEPQGGTNFNFYDESGENIIHRGRNIDLGQVESSFSILVSNTDSTLESFVTKVDIRISKPKADFEMSTDTLNLFQTDTLLIDFIGYGVDNWFWDFGNNTSSSLANPMVIYEEKGIYQIELIAADSIGCLDTLRQQLVVLDTPIINQDFEDDYNIALYPDPTTRNISLVINFKTPRNTSILVYNSMGQRIYEFPEELIQNRHYYLNMAKVSRGIYHVAIISEDKVIYRKIMVSD